MDISYLEELSDGDIEVQKELLDLFLATAEKSLNGFKQNFKNENDEQWKEFAHELKGSSLSLGFIAISEVCCKAQNNEVLDTELKIITITCVEEFINELRDSTTHLR